jgi:hypothetical protein
MTTPREEVDQLLKQAYQATQFMLEGAPGFDPFSLVMNHEGEINIVNAVLGMPGEEHPIEQRIGYARQVLRTMAAKKEAKATALVCMGQIRCAGDEDYTDAVIIEVEHEEDGAVTFYVPVETQGKKCELGEPIAKRCAPSVFQQEGDSEQSGC